MLPRYRGRPRFTISIAQKSAGRWNHIPTYRIQCDIRDLALRMWHMCARIVSGTRVPGPGGCASTAGIEERMRGRGARGGAGGGQVRAARSIGSFEGCTGPVPDATPRSSCICPCEPVNMHPLPASSETFFSLPTSVPSPRSQETPGGREVTRPLPRPTAFLPFRGPSPPLL